MRKILYLILCLWVVMPSLAATQNYDVSENEEIRPEDFSTPEEYIRATRRVQMLRDNAVTRPDFSVRPLKATEIVFKESQVTMTPEEIENIIRNSGLRGTIQEQMLVAFENALIDIIVFPEKILLTIGVIYTSISGEQVGEQWRYMTYEAMSNTISAMDLNEKSVGGIRSPFAKLVGVLTSFPVLMVNLYSPDINKEGNK